MRGNRSVPTCGRRHGDRCAPAQPPLSGQSQGVAHSRGQVGQDVAGGRARDLRLADAAVLGGVLQPVSAHPGPRSLPAQGEGGLRGLSSFQVCGGVDI